MVNVRGMGEDARLRMLALVRDKLGFNEACKKLCVSKPSMYRYLRSVPNRVVESCLKLLSDEEVRRALSAVERLKAMGLLREDG